MTMTMAGGVGGGPGTWNIDAYGTLEEKGQLLRGCSQNFPILESASV